MCVVVVAAAVPVVVVAFYPDGQLKTLPRPDLRRRDRGRWKKGVKKKKRGSLFSHK
jgi:hypothetical protein